MIAPAVASDTAGADQSAIPSAFEGWVAVVERGDADAYLRFVTEDAKVKVALERAWAHLEKVEQWPSWARHIERIDLRPSGPLGPAS